MGSLKTRKQVRFWLNDTFIELENLSPTQNLLDFLRLQSGLRGTKEGCAEGDCGACTVLVGRLSGDDLVYEAVNACIRFTASLDGCHVVSIEHLQGQNAQLHPVQAAMVALHGSQCGFCSPGIVMSLYALWMNQPNADKNAIERALQGNLCRCTGYVPIIRAARKALAEGGQSTDPLVNERQQMLEKLTELADGARVEMGLDGERLILPANVDDLARVLGEYPEATLVAGATDVGLWVTKFMRDLGTVVFTSHLEELHMVLEGEEGVTFGAGVTFSQFWPLVHSRFAAMRDLWGRIGGEQVRNMGTIGGNIANGSPIGDTPPALIALGAALTLRKGDKRRFLPLEEFFIAYGKQDRGPGEFVESISIPYLSEGDQFAVYKISKRREEDISTLCGAFRLRLDASNRVEEIVIAFGGMAGIPKRANIVEKLISGRVWDQNTIALGKAAFARDFTPMSDVRGSAEYRMLSAQNLLQRFYLETQGQSQELKRGGS